MWNPKKEEKVVAPTENVKSETKVNNFTERCVPVLVLPIYIKKKKKDL